MTQSNYLIGANQPGISYRTADNLGKQALMTAHKGATRPSYAEAGTIWIQDPGSGNLWKVFLWDGTTDILMGYAKITGSSVVEYIAAGSSIYCESSTRSGNDFVVTTGLSLSGFSKGDRFTVKNDNIYYNDAESGLIIDGLSSVPIYKEGEGDSYTGFTLLGEGDILGKSTFEVVYDGTNFVLLTPTASGYQGYDTVSRGDTLTTFHRGKLVRIRVDLGTGDLTLPNPSTTEGFGEGFWVDLQNEEESIVINATDCDIDRDPSITLRPSQAVRIVSDGYNYFTFSGGTGGFNAPIVYVDSGSTTSASVFSGVVYAKNVAATITTPPVGDISEGWCMIVKNDGVATNVTIDTFGSETIDGASSITVLPGQSCAVFFDGSDFYSFFSFAAATQSEQETATSTAVYVSPGRQQYHPSAAKAWVNFNGTGTVAINASYNITSVTDLGGTGLYQPNFTVGMSSANYAVATSGNGLSASGTGSGGAYQGPAIYSLATGSFALACGSNTATVGDWPLVCAVVFGDQ